MTSAISSALFFEGSSEIVMGTATGMVVMIEAATCWSESAFGVTAVGSFFFVDLLIFELKLAS